MTPDVSRDVVGLALVWVGAALSLAFGVRALLTREVVWRARLAAFAVFGLAVVATYLMSRPRGDSLAMPISIAFFSVALLLFPLVLNGLRRRGRD